MKKIAIMQPYFFPYLGYFQLIHAVDTFVLYDDVNYINKGYINRNSILASGQAQKITLELLGASQNKLINQILVGHNASKLLKTLELAYKKAPFFNEAFPIIENILLNKERNLSKFVGDSLLILADYLELKTQFLYSSAIEKDNTLKAQDKILEICKKIKADVYINAIGGQTLYDKSIFLKENIQLSFLQPKPIEYKQFNDTFVPYLSIIDVLMFNSKQEVSKVLNLYELI